MLVTLLVLMTLFVAYSNGANDNFKGVATLYGSNTTDFKTALWIGTVVTLAGCVSSVFLADALVQSFSGKGLVPNVVAESPNFLVAVAAGAASTVMLATVLGFPISTTHALTGALVGAGFVAAGSELNPLGAGWRLLPTASGEPAGVDPAHYAAVQTCSQRLDEVWHQQGNLCLHRTATVRPG